MPNKEDCLDFNICSANFQRTDEQGKGPSDLGCEDCDEYKPGIFIELSVEDIQGYKNLREEAQQLRKQVSEPL